MSRPCRHCGQPSVRCLGTTPLCANCLEEIRAPIRIKIAERAGVAGWMDRTGRNRPEFGAGMCDCRCVTCGAGMVAWIGEPCPWCASWLAMAQQIERDRRARTERSMAAAA